LSVGIADDIITSTLLATETPTFVAPAMNVHMYENPRTQHNIEVLRGDGYQFIEPGDGYLACGYVAKGRMEEPLQIVSVINQFFNNDKVSSDSSFSGKRALVTAGPTVEVIDPVRYVTNRSSGKMGFAIAEALRDKGAEVTLITGPTQLNDPTGIN
ncbi:bifunctional phosphopantothenoylcysteine decarboxylase/phosphopantothenate synthase, partial [Enterobacter quasiroggenkampii]|nr:bifunctional phosphopantothenoylcysteine decarboxylase/phosphopantothenate synthase [Enterobacter quasiroggenkampii]